MIARLATVVLLAALNAAALAAPPAKTQLPLVTPTAARLSTGYSDGKATLSLDALRDGRAVLLNVWATWCPPCVKELPALDRLSAKLAPSVLVVALSTDDGGVAQVRPFLDKLGIRHLTPLYDRDARAFQDFALRGLPTTLLIDGTGQIVARLEGIADWDSPAIAEQIRQLAGSHRRAQR
ncbi:MAG TPA: TlpA disulfide reductase family protein [Rhodocyclaceae bacterium]